MAEKEALQAQLEQNRNDRQKLIEEGERLLKEIEDAETTYSIGDRFLQRGGGKYLLGIQNQTNSVWYKVSLIDLDNGQIWSRPRKVENTCHITKSELEVICSSGAFTRYWDYQKKELTT